MHRRRLRYGPERSQVGNLWYPRGTRGPLPTVVLLHGGFWRPLYTKAIMRPLAARLVGRGWAVWNIEYRRVGRGGGWPATFLDVSAAVEHLATLDCVDLGRTVACGHSAGGLLALWAAARNRLPDGVLPQPPAVKLRGAVALAAVVDLAAAAKRESPDGPVRRFMGGLPDELPAGYAAASPFALLPIGVPQVLVHGLDDTLIPPRSSERYQRAAAEAGDDVRYVPVPGVDHRHLVSPRAASWPLIVEELSRLLGA
jgi:acetyl esterase/lipase